MGGLFMRMDKFGMSRGVFQVPLDCARNTRAVGSIYGSARQQ